MVEKTTVTPCVCLSHDNKEGGLSIEVQLPGVDKKDISLEMRKDSFCVTAPRGKDTEYSGCFRLAHEVEAGKTEARYENGLLKVFAPLKGWQERSFIAVQ